MVGPISTEERTSQMLKLKLGIAALVGVSMGLVGLQIDASLPGLALAVALGTVLGAALAWYVFPSGEEYKGDEDRPSYRDEDSYKR